MLRPRSFTLAVYSLIALLALRPEGDGRILRFWLIGVAGVVYNLNIAVKVARNARLFLDAQRFHGGIPFICYAGLITAVTVSSLVATSRHKFISLNSIKPCVEAA